MPVAHVLSSHCDVNAADSLFCWFNLTQKVEILRCGGWILKRAEVVGGEGDGDVLSNCGVLRGFFENSNESRQSSIFVHNLCTFCAETSVLSSQRLNVNRLNMVEGQVYLETKKRHKDQLKALLLVFDLVPKWVICFNAVESEWS